MTIENLRAMSISELKQELTNIEENKVNLQMQYALGQPVDRQLAAMKRNIARIKCLITEKNTRGEG